VRPLAHPAVPARPRADVAVAASGVPLYQRQRRWIVIAGLLGIAVLVFVVTRGDLEQLRRTARGTDPVLLLIPVLATVGSYLTMARSYQGIAAAAGHEIGFVDMLRITVVANTANYLLSAGGLSGFALRMYLFIRRGIPAGSAVLISLVQTLLTNLVLLLFVVGGFVVLFLSHDLVGRELVLSTVLLVGFSALILFATLLIFRRELRRRTLFAATRLIDRGWRRFLPHRKPSRLKLLRFQRNLNAGLDFLLERPHEMLAPTIYIVLDWVCTLLVLWGAFVAIGHPVRMSYVIAGFAIGMFFSIVSLVPAGLGILEGSMAAVFASLDVPLERAVVAVLIFRAAYYLLPLLASAVLARPTLRAVN
jgi:uncharacterized protein (TIRG00374 family)